MQTFVALDFETANDNRASACEIALVRFDNGQLKESYSTLLLPPEELRVFTNQQSHDISLKQCLTAPTLSDCLQDIRNFISEDALVCHDRRFDMSVMRSTLDYFACSYPSTDWFCSYLFTKSAFPNKKHHRLVNATSYLNIEFEETHRAEPDAIACGKVVAELLKRQNTTSIYNLAEKLNVSPRELSREPHKIHPQRRKNNDRSSVSIKSIQKRLGLKELNPSKSLVGKQFVFTGKLQSLERLEAEAIVEKAGALITKKPSRKTDFMVSGKQTASNVGEGGISGSQRTCRDLQSQGHKIEDIDEAGFLKLLAH